MTTITSEPAGDELLYNRHEEWRHTLGRVFFGDDGFILTLYDSQTCTSPKYHVVAPKLIFPSAACERPFAFAICTPTTVLANYYHWDVQPLPSDTLIFRFNTNGFFYTPPGCSYVFRTTPPLRTALPPPLGCPNLLTRGAVTQRPGFAFPVLPHDFMSQLMRVFPPEMSAVLGFRFRLEQRGRWLSLRTPHGSSVLQHILQKCSSRSAI